MISRIWSWLGNTPIKDPVDRRNASFMQMLLVFEGLRIPATKIYLCWLHWGYLQEHFYARARIGYTAAIAIDMGTDVLMTMSAWLGFYMIRVGRFRPAVAQYVATMLGSGAIVYVAFGYHATDGNLTLIMIMALSGMMLGRRALWITYVAEAAILVLSVDPLKPQGAMHLPSLWLDVYSQLPLRALTSYLLIAIILDRSIHALRQSLIESDERGRQLLEEIAERERTREQLLHAQKLDAVGKLASGVAHDVNNVFDIILGFSTEKDRLEDMPPPLDGDQQALFDALEGIELAARRGTAVCRKLLNFSRSDVTRVEVFDAGLALCELRALVVQLLAPTCSLRINLPEAPCLVRFDRSQFELAIINLVTNARDAMPAGGQCTIELQALGQWIMLAIRDTGMGMEPATSARVFEPFFTTKPPGQGTGLGLSVVHTVVSAAGGHMSIRSALGQGTTIQIRLPANDAHMEVIAATDGRAALLGADSGGGWPAVVRVQASRT